MCILRNDHALKGLGFVPDETPLVRNLRMMKIERDANA
jgi:hypothetical protein